MIRDLIKWVVPGLATVLGGTTLCLAMTSAEIANDLTARTSAAITAGKFDWAEISVNARDLTLTGTTTDQAYVDAAIARLSSLDGVRSVAVDVTLAPLSRPYVLVASVDQDAIFLSGGVPNATSQRDLLTLAGLDQAALELRSGIPDREAWMAGAQFVIEQLKHFDQGEAAISDLTISLNGRARSERDFRDLLIIMRAGAPTGLTLGSVQIRPALVSPYHWNAVFDGERIDVSGYVPDDALLERFRTADVSGAQVATGLALGSGEPTGFADLSHQLLEQLALLEYGAASIIDGKSTLNGAPATQQIAQGIVDTLEPSGTIVVLEPPRIDDYWMSATRQPGGVVVFDGYVPDEVTREAFSQREGADTTYLKLGRGAPERYRSGADFGLDALQLMSEGRIALRDNVLTIAGTARTGADYNALLAALAEPPQGLVLARAEVLAPRAATYSWDVTKGASGALTFSGLVPSADDGARILSFAGQSATNSMTYASGEPNGFVNATDVALSLLTWLKEGRVNYDGQSWTLTGTAKSTIDKAALEADFVTRQLAAAGWSMAVAAPPPIVPQVSPYAWSATRTSGGVTLMGHVPDESLKSYLVMHAGDAVVDTMQLGLGAPDDFTEAAKAGLDAVLALEEGEASFDGSNWSLTGRASSEAERNALLATLSAATAISGWSIDITTLAPKSVATTPYSWSATKTADGAVSLSGLVPALSTQQFLAVRIGIAVSDQTTIDATAPEGFARDLVAAVDALAALSEGTVSYDGRNWTVAGTLRDSDGAASVDLAIVAATTPATNWSLSLAAPAPVADAETLPPLTAAVDPNYAFSARRSADGAVTLSGQIPADPAMRYFAAITGGDFAAVSLAEGAPETFLPSAEAGLRALLFLTEGQLDFASGKWSLTGTASSESAREEALAAIALDPQAASWDVLLDVPTPSTVPQPVAQPEPEPATPPASSAESATPLPATASAVDIAACAAPVAEFSARNVILFQSGAALIAAESDAALDELAVDLAACPDAVVHIEGHTDADGEEALNMALSVARAEAVVNALVSRGVTAARLYAVGYGETAPIADNETPAGKRLNRRIVVTVQPEHY